MLFPIPAPDFWSDPGPIEYSAFLRSVWSKINPFFEVKKEWVEQYKTWLARIERDEEAYKIYLDQLEAYEIMMAQYQEEGEHMAYMLPVYLHHLGLSYRRTVQDRKSERPYEKVDYCEVEHWFFDSYAYYFWIKTWPLPFGVRVSHFQPANFVKETDPDSDVGLTLSANFGARTITEFNDRSHDRPGLWVIVEHKAGRGKVPLHVSYQQCLNEMPKTSSPLAFPVGHGNNNRGYIVDLGEITNLLIGGSQGGGKSNIMNVILSTFIRRNSPQDLRLFLADFKRVEFAFYRGIPHLGGDVPYLQKMTLDKEGKEKPGPIRTVAANYQPKEGQELHKALGSNIITEGEQLIKILDYALAEIDRRTTLLERHLVKKISAWNKRFPKEKLSRWLIVIDELGDVMLQASLKKNIEPKLIRIAQLGRAMGVHIILATQTPKNEIVTLLIQNNIVNRLVFRCGTGQASGVMLDGLYDAARLVANPGRCIFREGARLIELQTPEITDLTVKEAVKLAKSGELDSAAIEKKRTIAPDKVFQYALDDLGGFCPVDDLYNHFRHQRVPRVEIMEILSDYEVKGAPPALEPEIELGDDLYYLAPGEGGRKPRMLVKEADFIREFETRWAKVLEFRVLRTGDTRKTAIQQNLEISKPQESLEGEGLIEVIADDDLAQELEDEYLADRYNGS